MLEFPIVPWTQSEQFLFAGSIDINSTHYQSEWQDSTRYITVQYSTVQYYSTQNYGQTCKTCISLRFHPFCFALFLWKCSKDGSASDESKPCQLWWWDDVTNGLLYHVILRDEPVVASSRHVVWFLLPRSHARSCTRRNWSEIQVLRVC
jgi:hypothetical protein